MYFSLFDLIAILLVVSVVFAWLNSRFLKLPTTIGVTAMGLGASLLLIAVELVSHNTKLYGAVTDMLRQIDFTAAVMNGMLAFLLFSAALHVNFSRFTERLITIGSLATIGVLFATVLTGFLLWLVAGALNAPVTLAWALVFGALISPTDPVAMVGVLRTRRVPRSMETVMSGESLLNDGAGVVLFTVLIAFATTQKELHIADVAGQFLLEAAGGCMLGLLAGYVAYRAIRALDEYPIEVMITLALVMGTYSLANKLHVSGPLAVVCAGILVAERGPADALTEKSERYVFAFWTLVDQILNIVLFMLIGLEVLIVNYDTGALPFALAAIPIVIVARFVSVSIPVRVLGRIKPFPRGTLIVLTWGGVRGGISIALALAMPASDAKTPLLMATYAVVLFTLLAQGLTLGWAIRRFAGAESGSR